MYHLISYLLLLAITGLGLMIIYLMIKEQFIKRDAAMINYIKFITWLYSTNK